MHHLDFPKIGTDAWAEMRRHAYAEPMDLDSIFFQVPDRQLQDLRHDERVIEETTSRKLKSTSYFCGLTNNATAVTREKLISTHPKAGLCYIYTLRLKPI